MDHRRHVIAHEPVGGRLEPLGVGRGVCAVDPEGWGVPELAFGLTIADVASSTTGLHDTEPFRREPDTNAG